MGQVPFNYCQQNLQVNSFDIWLDGRWAPCNAAARAEKSFVSKSVRDWDEFFGDITNHVIENLDFLITSTEGVLAV